MQQTPLKEDELTTLGKERASLRCFISCARSGVRGKLWPNSNTLQANFNRLCEVNDALVGHHLASEEPETAEKELSDHAKYADYMSEIHAAIQPEATLVKPKAITFPQITAKDPASWLSFKTIFTAATKSAEWSDDAKLLHLLSALPPSERMKLENKKFSEAWTCLDERLGSKEMLHDKVEEIFESINKVDQPEKSLFKAIAEALEDIAALTDDGEVRLSAFNKAVALIPRNTFNNFNDLFRSKNIVSMAEFLRNRSAGARILDSIGSRNSNGKHFKKHQQKQSKVFGKPDQLSNNVTNKKKFTRKPKSVNSIQNGQVSGNESDDSVNSSSNKINSSFYESIGNIYLTELDDASDSECEEEIRIDASIDDNKVSLLWDPGAAHTLLPHHLFPETTLTKRFTSASGHPINAYGPVHVNLTMNDELIPVKAYINDMNLSILGRNFTGKTTAESDGTSTTRICLLHENKTIPIYQRPRRKNTNRFDQTSTYADICQILPCDRSELIDDILKDISNTEDSGFHLSGETLSSPKLAKLLEKWQKLSIGLGDYGDKVMMRIYMDPNTPPVVNPQRRIPPKWIPATRDAVEELLNLGVISYSKSPFRSNMVHVKKPDGSVRIAFDYKALNDVCKKDAYPMPRIDEIFESLSKAKVFSKLDLTKGYYQVRIHPADREKTAFSFEGRLYEFNRIPFGLHSAPQEFQRMMNEVLAGLPFAKPYLDDIIIFSDSLEEHIKHLEIVFKALNRANLRINSKKCIYAVTQVEFLGYKVGAGLRSPTDKKMEQIKNFRTPTSKAELDTFIGITGQYRALINGYSSKAQCLTDLKKRLRGKKRLDFKSFWTAEHEKAMNELKDELTKPPVTALPDLNRPFIVRTDASNLGMGAVLLQVVNGHRRIIEYASKQFSDTQKRYPTIEQEATAILWALVKWQHFLLGGGFTLETDHRPLQFLTSKINSNGKLARMALRLQEFQPFNIIHIPGKENVEADYLSRLIATISLDYSEQDDIYQRRMNKPAEFISDGRGRFRFVGDGNNRLAIPAKHREEIMKALHDDHGHFHLDRVLDLARSRFYWKGMNKDIKNYIKSCHQCALSQHSAPPKAEMKSTVSEVTRPFERWHFDIIGPLPASSCGNKYVFVAQDAFSKWPEASAVKTCPTTQTITEWLQQNVVLRFGTPSEIMTDRGSQLESKEFRDWIQDNGISHLLASPYHHQTNGVVERFNGTLESKIRTLSDDIKDWDLSIDKCLHAYRTTVHRSTKRSPYEIIYGRKARLDIDAKLDIDTPNLVDNHQTILQKVADNILIEANKSKARYDKGKKREPRKLDGLKVYWKEDWPPKEGKLTNPWKGPYLSTRTESPWNFKITDADGRSKIVHVDQLKPCHNTNQPLASGPSGLRGRGRPPRRFNTICFYPTNRRIKGEV